MIKACVADGCPKMLCRSDTCCCGSPHIFEPIKDPDGKQYNAQQELTCTATGGSFTLTFRGFTTGAIPFSASAEEIVDALQSLPSLYGSYDTPVSVQFSSSETQATSIQVYLCVNSWCFFFNFSLSWFLPLAPRLASPESVERVGNMP